MAQYQRIVVCSSPNGRGISRYADYLTLLVQGRLITCREATRYYVVWELIGILREAKSLVCADEVIFANTRVSPLLWLVLNWEKITVVVHDLMDTDAEKIDSQCQRGIIKWVVVRVNSWIVRESIRRAGRVIFNSSCTESEARQWVKIQPVNSTVIYPPPSFGAFPSVGSVELREERGCSQIFQILVVAGMSANKSYDEYKRFQESLRARVEIDVKLIVYGVELRRANSEFNRWVAREGEMVEIKYKKAATELLGDYLSSDLFVSLSRNEGYGMPVADAVALGIPVLARSICAYREIKREFDVCNIVRLIEGVDQCIEEAARVVRSPRVRESKEVRLRRYKRFYNRNQSVASQRLSELGVV